MNDKTVSATSYLGAAYSVLSSMTLTEWGIVTGIITALATFALNAWWGSRRDRREHQAHLLKLERLQVDRRQCDEPVAHDRRRQGGAINRTLVAGMGLSAAALITLAVSEGYVPEAMIPVRGDPPTVGFGSTKHADGAAVQLGDRLDPVRALVTLQAHVARDEAAFQRSLPGARLNQAEYDLYLDFAYQYGISNWEKSSMRRQVLAGKYRAACDALLRYRYASGFDCSTPGNRVCPGVWTRQLERHAKCVAAQGEGQ